MSVKYPIQVTLPVLKALTAELQEGQTYDDVLRQRLGIDSIVEPEPESVDDRKINYDAIERVVHAYSDKGGYFSRGLWLPNGTELRARYKQREFWARIVNNAWVDASGNRHTSPSAAATAITDTSVNGLRFWEARRPGDTSWRRLDQLVQP